MGRWIDARRNYRPQHGQLLIGPLRDKQYEHLKTVTFFVNPDQLSLFVIGAHYTPLISAPFSSACGLLLPLFDDLERPAAIIGATDIAVQRHLPPDILAFSVTKPLYEQLCALDEHSFLNKKFWQDVRKARSRENKD